MLFCLLELEDEYFIPIYSSIQSSNIFPAKPMEIPSYSLWQD